MKLLVLYSRCLAENPLEIFSLFENQDKHLSFILKCRNKILVSGDLVDYNQVRRPMKQLLVL